MEGGLIHASMAGNLPQPRLPSYCCSPPSCNVALHETAVGCFLHSSCYLRACFLFSVFLCVVWDLPSGSKRLGPSQSWRLAAGCLWSQCIPELFSFSQEPFEISILVLSISQNLEAEALQGLSKLTQGYRSERWDSNPDSQTAGPKSLNHCKNPH